MRVPHHRKERKDGGGAAYDQTFFRTEQGIRAHRSRGQVELSAEPVALDVVIDSGRRYPLALSPGHRQPTPAAGGRLRPDGRRPHGGGGGAKNYANFRGAGAATRGCITN
ncbi:MAG: hypothetical protein IPG75_14910 [Gemmatimonadetes bacterium]|nr:hypothetical protein [Gemmatimonadota bacterium]